MSAGTPGGRTRNAIAVCYVTGAHPMPSVGVGWEVAAGRWYRPVATPIGDYSGVIVKLGVYLPYVSQSAFLIAYFRLNG